VPLTGLRPGQAQQATRLTLFLASDESDHIAGTEVSIDGAESLQMASRILREKNDRITRTKRKVRRPSVFIAGSDRGAVEIRAPGAPQWRPRCAKYTRLLN
jgi:hypothetical protein